MMVDADIKALAEIKCSRDITKKIKGDKKA